MVGWPTIKMKLIKDLSFNFGAALVLRLLTNFIGLLVVGILTRALGPSGFGIYSTIFAYLFLFSTLADMGLGVMLTRDISRQDGDESEIISRYFSLRLILVLAAALAAVVIVFFIPQYSNTVKQGVFLGVSYMVFTSLTQVLIGLFQKHLKIYLVSIADIVSRLAQLALLLVALWYGSGSVVLFVVITALSELVHFLVVWHFSRHMALFGFQVDYEKLKKTLRAALPIAISLLFVMLYFKMDTVMLSLMRASGEVGIYAAAYKVLEVLIFVPSILAGLIMPLLAKEAVHSSQRFKKIMSLSFDAIAALALPCVAILIILAPQIIRIVGGPQFSGAIVILQILAPAVLFIFFGSLGGNALVALNLQAKGVWVYGLGAAVNFAANLIFIPRFGAVAAAWNTVITEALVTLGMFYLIHTAVSSTVSFNRSYRIVSATLLMSALILLCRQYFILPFVAALIYFPLLYILGGISIDEIKQLSGRA